MGRAQVGQPQQQRNPGGEANTCSEPQPILMQNHRHEASSVPSTRVGFTSQSPGASCGSAADLCGGESDSGGYPILNVRVACR